MTSSDRSNEETDESREGQADVRTAAIDGAGLPHKDVAVGGIDKAPQVTVAAGNDLDTMESVVEQLVPDNSKAAASSAEVDRIDKTAAAMAEEKQLVVDMAPASDMSVTSSASCEDESLIAAAGGGAALETAKELAREVDHAIAVVGGEEQALTMVQDPAAEKGVNVSFT